MALYAVDLEIESDIPLFDGKKVCRNLLAGATTKLEKERSWAIERHRIHCFHMTVTCGELPNVFRIPMPG